jgi:hypothetical protein
VRTCDQLREAIAKWDNKGGALKSGDRSRS